MSIFPCFGENGEKIILNFFNFIKSVFSLSYVYENLDKSEFIGPTHEVLLSNERKLKCYFLVGLFIMQNEADVADVSEADLSESFTFFLSAILSYFQNDAVKWEAIWCQIFQVG